MVQVTVHDHNPELRDLSAPPTVRDLCPGYRLARWDAPATLSPPCRERLHRVLRDLAARAFGADHSSYWRARIDAGFFDQVSSLALILGPDGSPVGWGGYHRRRFASRRAVYLDAAGVVPAHRRSGLSAALMIRFMAREVLAHPFRSTYVVLRTRHPAVYAAWRQSLGDARVFPNELRPLPARVRRVAGEAAEWLGDGPNLDPDTLLIRDAYRVFDGRIYGTRPRSGHLALDDYFAHEVGPRDALLMVVRMSVPALARIIAGRLLYARRRPREVGDLPAGAGEPERGTAPRKERQGAAGITPGARP
ncbi:GNAT family N-acetyltransferase [Nocardiopsis dassonvillei]|uniref:GNAT family N-acetyltransferase n=1 Tax=Nocardiopsis dassonvillei TaxID=2014 RepID=UPI00200E2F0E|nr:GNAT family N-acetyltransferase [Nocardiopsis dassonvillei]MCK9868903.1 GNAT family N-acetyltransferase [Nocardiopsis dassonvillei]